LYDDGVRTSASIINYLATTRPNFSNHGYNFGGMTFDWDHPMYFAKGTDDLVTVRNRFDNRNGGDYGFAETEGVQIRVPHDAKPAGTFTGNTPQNDGHITVVQPNGDVFTAWKGELGIANGADWWVRWSAMEDDITSDGLTRTDKPGATAARFVAGLGVIRHDEMANANMDHALFAVCWKTRGHVFPASGDAAETTDTHAPPLGARFRYKKDEAYIAAQSWPGWLKTIARTLRDYGAYCGDTGGNSTDALTFRMESDVVYRSFTDFSSPYPNEVWADAQNDFTEVNSGGRLQFLMKLGDYDGSGGNSTFRIEDFEVIAPGSYAGSGGMHGKTGG
jgi:hypothetical protein